MSADIISAPNKVSAHLKANVVRLARSAIIMNMLLFMIKYITMKCYGNEDSHEYDNDKGLCKD